jgi:hypothetical protein
MEMLRMFLSISKLYGANLLSLKKFFGVQIRQSRGGMRQIILLVLTFKKNSNETNYYPGNKQL